MTMWKGSTRSYPKIKAIRTSNRCVKSSTYVQCTYCNLVWEFLCVKYFSGLNFVVECTNRLSHCAHPSVSLIHI